MTIEWVARCPEGRAPPRASKGKKGHPAYIAYREVDTTYYLRQLELLRTLNNALQAYLTFPKTMSVLYALGKVR